MAKFETAYEITADFEGGYVNDADDAGGETYSGISRVYHPTWDGWNDIDDMKMDPDFPRCLDDDDDLHVAVMDFYEQHYWDRNRLDEFPQSIANEMYDTGVNMGVKRAAKFLQEALNYLNRNEDSYPDLVVDGAIGRISIDSMEYIIEHGDEEILLVIMNVLQGMHYLNYMKKSPIQEKYARGWLKRVAL